MGLGIPRVRSSGRPISRFPNLDSVDLVSGCLISPPNSGILVNHRIVSFTVGVGTYQSWSFFEENLLPVEMVDRGLTTLADGCCSNLQRLVVTNTSELGLLNVAEECSRLQELELHKCSDSVFLLGIGAFENLQILRLIGNVDGLYSSLVSDIRSDDLGSRVQETGEASREGSCQCKDLVLESHR